MNKSLENDVIHQSRTIFAKYDDKTIRLYQAYNYEIANEALSIGTFGPSFKLERMTWIKPSFLWMMYRSGWGQKENQERVLAIDIYREGFEEILSKVILSTFDKDIYVARDDWQEQLHKSEVRCQWDPDRDIYGNPIKRRAVQLGLRGSMVKKYVNEWIVNITDISEEVHRWGNEVNESSFDETKLPDEKEYPVNDAIKKIIGINKEL